MPDTRPTEREPGVATALAAKPGAGPPPVTGPPSGWPRATMAPLHGPWVQQSVWGRRWPGPARPPGPPTVVAVCVAATVAALSVPLDRPGVGWLVTALAGVAALVIGRRWPVRAPVGVPAPRVHRTAPAGPSAARYGWSAATVALLAVGTVRAAGWLFLLCLCTAAVTGGLAVTGGRSVRAMAAAVGMSPIAALRALPWAGRGFATLHRPGAGQGSGTRIAATVAVSAGLLIVFGALFASADATFARILRRALPHVDGGTVARWCFVALVAGAVLFGAAYLRAAPPDLTGLGPPSTGRVHRWEWAMPLGLLVVLFAAFVAVQVTILFGGTRHVLGTDGLTYAGYARGGFWQLLMVTGLTLAVLAGAARWAPRDTRTDRVLIRVLLGALAVLTLVIVASALHRMDLYADTYGLTRLRLLVALCEAWLGVVFVLVVIAGVRLRAPWLPRAVAAAGVLALLGLAAANPDALIADRNIDRYARDGRIDTWYLATLSADAVPSLLRLTPELRGCVLPALAGELRRDPDDWRGFNAGRQRARELLGPWTVAGLKSCPPALRD